MPKLVFSGTLRESRVFDDTVAGLRYARARA
jgi:hypothetical protein